MLGYRVHRWSSDPTWSEIAERAPERGEVVVDVETCGVGLTVLNCIRGDLSSSPDLLPRVPGHEFFGRISSVGDEVDPDLIGRPVVAYFYLFCGMCEACLAGLQPRCEHLAGWVGVNVDGGYAPRAVLPARNVVVVPDDLDPLAATVVPDAVATPVHVADRAQITSGDRVVVIGAGGGVGIHMIQVARVRGAEVVGLETAEPKLARISDLDVDAVASPDITRLVPGLFGGSRPTVVVDLVGTRDTVRWAIDSLDMAGRMVALTTFVDRPATFESRDLVFRELSLLGSRYATIAQVEEAARLVRGGDVVPVIGEVAGPDEVLRLHDRLREGSLVGRGALDWRRSPARAEGV